MSKPYYCQKLLDITDKNEALKVIKDEHLKITTEV